MFSHLLVASFIVTISVAATLSADVFRPQSPQLEELSRVDPGKTLLLIKRIKSATGSGLVVS